MSAGAAGASAAGLCGKQQPWNTAAISPPAKFRATCAICKISKFANLHNCKFLEGSLLSCIETNAAGKVAKTNYVHASIPKEKTGYYLFLKVTF